MKKVFGVFVRLLIVLCVAIGVATFLGIDVTKLNLSNFSVSELSEAENVEDVQDWYLEQVGEVVVGEPVKVGSVSYDRYAYQQLDETTQEVYDQLLNTVLNHDEKVVLLTKDSQVLDNAFDAMKADYGGLFWFSGYICNTYTKAGKVISLEFVPSYTMTRQQREETQARIDQVVEQWLAGISITDSDYDKAKYVFETLIEKADYDTSSEDNQNIVSVFLNQSTVCQGYSDAAWYMLENLGIHSTVITGRANGQPHAWNLIELDGEYYYMDVTWGNSKYLNASSQEEKHINYAYMAMTSEELMSTHTVDSCFEVPECVSNVDNYFVREGLYFGTWDLAAIGYTIGDSWDAQDKELSLKFSNAELLNQTVQYFVTEMHLTDFCWDIRNVSYITDDSVNVITFQWTRE